MTLDTGGLVSVTPWNGKLGAGTACSIVMTSGEYHEQEPFIAFCWIGCRIGDDGGSSYRRGGIDLRVRKWPLRLHRLELNAFRFAGVKKLVVAIPAASFSIPRSTTVQVDTLFLSPAINFTARRVLTYATSIAIACAGMVAYSQPVSSTTSQYRADSHAFLVAYLKDSDSLHYQPRANFTIPAVWLFAPNGNLVSISDDSSQLPRLGQTFPPQSTQALPNEPSLQTMEKVLGDATGASVSLHGDPSQWTALLFFGDSPECKYCAMFKQAADDLERAKAPHLHLVSLFVR